MYWQTFVMPVQNMGSIDVVAKLVAHSLLFRVAKNSVFFCNKKTGFTKACDMDRSTVEDGG